MPLRFSVVNAKEGNLITQRRGHQAFLNNLDLLGSEYLWKIILQAGEEVADRAIELFKLVRFLVDVIIP